jgi:hypothetical protein
MRLRLICSTLAILVLVLTVNAGARDVVLPAGTLLQCTLNEPNFSSATAAVGDPVLCHLRGMTSFGQQAFPRGSYLVGHLESDKNPGHFFGKGNLKLQFDRIGLPNGDLPLDAKVIATRGYKVNREGAINGKGHAKRDIVEWMLPPLWPWKVMMLPARGPRPALKGESVMTLRLMDDIELPQIAQVPSNYRENWRHFGSPTGQALPESQVFGSRPRLAVRDVPTSSATEPAHRHLSLSSLKTASLKTDADYVPPPETARGQFDTAQLHSSASGPGIPVFVLKTGTVLTVANYSYQSGRIAYSLDGGGSGVIDTDEVDWNSTLRVNAERGVRVTLRNGHAALGTPGM